MFMPNDVYQLESRLIRILWSNPEVIFYIDLENDRALPERSPREELEHLMSKGDLVAIKDPFISVAMTFPEPESKAEVVQERAWKAIKKAVFSEPDVYLRL